MANKYRTSYQSPSTFKQMVFVAFFIVMAGVTYYFANVLIKRNQQLAVGAASGKADLFFEPAAVTLPPDGLVSLWVTTDKQLGFSATDITFNPAQIKLASEVVLPTSTLKQRIKVTSMAEANTTGKISVVIAVDPTTLLTAPTGSFALANLKFTTVSTTANQLSTLAVATSGLQLVDTAMTPFTVTSKTASMTLNPVAATPTPTSTPSPSPSITPTPTPTPSASASPSPTPIAATDLIPPTLTLSSRRPWTGRYTITAKASDSSGISAITMFKDGVKVKTCTSTTSCSFTSPSSYVRPYTIVVTATDNTAIKNLTTGTITIK